MELLELLQCMLLTSRISILQLLVAFWTNNVRLVVKNWTRSVGVYLSLVLVSQLKYFVMLFHVFHASQTANFFFLQIENPQCFIPCSSIF